MTIFVLPDLGEGLPDAEIATWHVQIGQDIEKDAPIVSMETAKALVEVPSPYKGKVVQLYGKPGDVIKTGSPLVEIELEDKGTVAGILEESNQILNEVEIPLSQEPVLRTSVKVTPAVRALAKQLKVDLNKIVPANPNGILTKQEVEEAGKKLQEQALVSLEPLMDVRKRMLEVMYQAKIETVPVSVMEDAKLVKFNKNRDITVQVMLGMILACQQEQALNVWYDSKTRSRQLMPSVHLGIAIDTEEGLFVPVIHDAQKLNESELRERLNYLKVAVANRNILPKELQGGTITLSNFGKFSGRYATPIIVPPTVAILAVGKMRQEMIIVEDKPQVGEVLPLSLTFDHRVVTGGEASRFLGIVVKYLENS